MTDIAANTQALKKRVIRFFGSPKLSEVMSLIDSISLLGEVLVFGGLLRDIALYGTRRFNSDIDLVVECSPEELYDFFGQRLDGVQRNKFGGYRIEVGGWTIDVWPICETWAFKNGHVVYECRESLLLTTITNWDAIIFSFKDKQIISGPGYFDCLRLGELDVVLTENPSEIGVLMRVIKSICDRRARVLMPRALMYLKSELLKWSAEQIVIAQKNNLGKIYLSGSEVNAFRKEVFSLDEDLFGSPLFIKGRNLTLKFGNRT